MELQLRKQNLSLEQDLIRNACRFSFEMAAYILEHSSDISFGKNIAVNQAPFRTVSINSFHLRGTEIEKIETIEEQKTIFIERLAITGLNAPLPTPYGELILKRSREQDNAMASFVNVFNSRLLGISYQISKRRYLNLQNHKNGNCPFVQTLAAFCGEDLKKMDRRFSRIAELLWMREKNVSGLESIIISLFGFQAKINQFQKSWENLSENNRLNKNYLRLGVNSGLGSRALVSDLKIIINLTHDNFEKICKLLRFSKNDLDENREAIELEQLKYIVKKYIGDFYICQINITPRTVPPLYLSAEKNNKPILGRIAWLFTSFAGAKFDSAIINLC